MLKVSHGGIEAWADAARSHPGGWGNGGDLVMLSMFGPRNAVRSLWATLVGGGKTAGVMIGKDYFSAATGVRYASVQTPMPRRMTHLILVDPACTHQVSSFAGQFVQLGASAHEDFFSRLNRFCPVPFRRSWRDALWTLGLESELIAPLPGFGIAAYSVDAGPQWAGVVKSGIQNGVLS